MKRKFDRRVSDRSGVCVCGVPVSDHYDGRNARVPCEIAMRRHGDQVQTSTDAVDQTFAAQMQSMAPGLRRLRLVKSDRERQK